MAQIYGITITPPRFEASDADYVYDKASGVIAKGISSLKGYGEAVCHKLHDIGQKRHQRFSMALEDLYQASIKAANIRPLIRIDYFQSYGNSVELDRILGIFDMFCPTNNSRTKQVDKDKVAGTPLHDMILRHGTDKTSKGSDAKRLTITDFDGFMVEVEEYVYQLGLQDVDIKVKMQNQEEILGYVDLTTGRPEDRRKLLITDLVPLRSKYGEIWAYAVFTRSIGTGKSARLTLRHTTYDQTPFHKSDVIYADRVAKEQSGYWYLYAYRIVM